MILQTSFLKFALEFTVTYAYVTFFRYLFLDNEMDKT